ncbi:MAG: hypothetical protein IT363_05970 [Methanoregulaceae archaeon]|nr:hypothetical protein [Methanoregulaceae archaeon]
MPIVKLSKIGELTPWTKTPNIVIDKLMPTLRDTEFRVLVILIRSTMGWNRSGAVVLSYRTLKQRTGRSSEAIANALRRLEAQGVIHILDSRHARKRRNAKLGASESERH